MTQEDKQISGLKVLVAENERAKKFGFTQSELDRAESDYLSRYENAFKDKDKTESDNFVQEYQSSFLKKSPVSGIDWEYTSVKQLLPTIKLQEVNDFINQKFNLLISYYDVEKAILLKVTHDSKAQFKVGFSSIDKKLNHLMINTNAENHTVFVHELFRYLKILSKI